MQDTFEAACEKDRNDARINNAFVLICLLIAFGPPIIVLIAYGVMSYQDACSSAQRISAICPSQRKDLEWLGILVAQMFYLAFLTTPTGLVLLAGNWLVARYSMRQHRPK